MILNIAKCHVDSLKAYRGGILTGLEIYEQVKRGNIIIEPFNIEQLNPNSYNLRLADKLKVYNVSKADRDYLDMRQDNPTDEIIIPPSGLVLEPNKLYIGSTVERTATEHFVPLIDGRSSGGRLGLSIHVCAGFGDIGFDGTWTLEITVTERLKIYPNAEIAQVNFETAFGSTGYKYRGRYYKQSGPTESRFEKEKTKESLVHDVIEEYELYEVICNLVTHLGDFWFSSRGYSLRNINASFELEEGEEVLDDPAFNSYDNNIYSKKDNSVIGNRFRIADYCKEPTHEWIYIRRK